MNAYPAHPVRARPEFIMLRHLERKPNRFGVKLRSGNPAMGGTFWQNHAAKWVYGTTAEEALDSALVHLVSQALHGD